MIPYLSGIVENAGFGGIFGGNLYNFFQRFIR